ncbi:MAG: hypothetical protein M3275_07800 [Thermoproteota archaeon]|nr:hypothetical protein [Thermoproteota archaeon]
MKHNLNNKKNNSIVTTAKVFSLATILVVALGVSTPLTALGSRLGGEEGFIQPTTFDRKAPSVVSGDNIYIAWWTNNTENGNEEVMFRASTDGGATFGDKINLSNSSDADSWRVEIAGEGENVIVSWWETNQTSDIPVARISTDAGETFGPLVMLAANGTLGSGEAEEIGVAGDEGEEGGG